MKDSINDDNEISDKINQIEADKNPVEISNKNPNLDYQCQYEFLCEGFGCTGVVLVWYSTGYSYSKYIK